MTCFHDIYREKIIGAQAIHRKLISDEKYSFFHQIIFFYIFFQAYEWILMPLSMMVKIFFDTNFQNNLGFASLNLPVQKLFALI